MSEAAPAPAAAPAVESAYKKKQPKKASGPKKADKPSSPSMSELIVKAVSASKELRGVSLPTLKKALAASGYYVDKNNSHLKLALKGLVTKETLVHVKGSGASGSFMLNKKQAESKDKAYGLQDSGDHVPEVVKCGQFAIDVKIVQVVNSTPVPNFEIKIRD
ncbi:histone H1B-like [Pelobates cultripes]|uniref:Histone H1B-like n=1 Tax=Pelobates cultripes TaxID=61616 RepID=A0AAD1R4I6_PELCU|nr:histone H1B-like [Pelobates cultripes]